MAEALAEADLAGEAGEIPVGAVVVGPAGEILGRGSNGPIAANDPTAHAEISAMRQAAAAMGNYRLNGCVLAVTLEPCLMCVGALVHARVTGVVFGAYDPKSGAVVSRLHGFELALHNHMPWQAGGVLENACAERLRSFFSSRRKGGA